MVDLAAAAHVRRLQGQPCVGGGGRRRRAAAARRAGGRGENCGCIISLPRRTSQHPLSRPCYRLCSRSISCCPVMAGELVLRVGQVAASGHPPAADGRLQSLSSTVWQHSCRRQLECCLRVQPCIARCIARCSPGVRVPRSGLTAAWVAKSRAHEGLRLVAGNGTTPQGACRGFEQTADSLLR